MNPCRSEDLRGKKIPIHAPVDFLGKKVPLRIIEFGIIPIDMIGRKNFVIFERISALILFFSVIITCATVPDRPALEEADTVSAAEFDREVNTLVHEGWAVAAPREWRFYSLQGAGSNDEMFRASTPDRQNAVSLHKIDFGFTPDVDTLADYASETLSEAGTMEESGEYPLERIRGGAAARYWYFEAELASGGVILEPDELVMWEWRYNVEPAVEPVIHTIVREARRYPVGWSERRTPRGYSFYSQGSRWRWSADVGDGMMIEKRVAEKEPRVTVAVFSLGTIEDGDEWLQGMVDDATVVTGELGIAGQPIAVAGHSSFVHDRILRTVIPPTVLAEAFGVPTDICIVFVVDGDEKPLPNAVFSDPEVVELFDRYLFLPTEDSQ